MRKHVAVIEVYLSKHTNALPGFVSSQEQMFCELFFKCRMRMNGFTVCRKDAFSERREHFSLPSQFMLKFSVFFPPSEHT